MTEKTFKCTRCKNVKPLASPTTFTTGYGLLRRGKRNVRICYDCCSDLDRRDMLKTGRATLYLVEKQDAEGRTMREVTNWPGSLRIPVRHTRQGGHNIAGTRIDAWFTYEGREWHGVLYGSNTQIIHVRRLKA